MNFTIFPLGRFGANCILAEHNGETALIDAGGDADIILRLLSEKGRAAPTCFIATHGHFDHISAFKTLQEAFPSHPLHIHSLDLPMLADAPLYAEEYGYGKTKAITDVAPLEGVICGFTVIHTPGHTAGSVCLYCEGYEWEEGKGLLITGDTLFAGSIGRTDLPYAVPHLIAPSIREKLYTLPDKTLVAAGHGELTTIGDEKAFNPFVRA